MTLCSTVKNPGVQVVWVAHSATSMNWHARVRIWFNRASSVHCASCVAQLLADNIRSIIGIPEPVPANSAPLAVFENLNSALWVITQTVLRGVRVRRRWSRSALHAVTSCSTYGRSCSSRRARCGTLLFSGRRRIDDTSAEHVVLLIVFCCVLSSGACWICLGFAFGAPSWVKTSRLRACMYYIYTHITHMHLLNLICTV